MIYLLFNFPNLFINKSYKSQNKSLKYSNPILILLNVENNPKKLSINTI